MLDSTWVIQQSNPDCFQFRVAFTIMLYNHTYLGVPPSICLFQYTLSVFLLPAGPQFADCIICLHDIHLPFYPSN